MDCYTHGCGILAKASSTLNVNQIVVPKPFPQKAMIVRRSWGATMPNEKHVKTLIYLQAISVNFDLKS